MNNQNPKGQNQNWRPHGYMQESRSHNVPRSQNYYPHYPPSQFINDYLHTGYVYPSLLPSYRSNEGPIPPSNSQIVNSLSMISPQDYGKYYSKMQNYIPQDPRHCIKGYPHHSPYFEHPHPYRTPHYHNIGLQNENPIQPINSAIYPPPQHNPSQSHIVKIDKTTKNKGIIVIESDEENIISNFEISKVPAQKKEEKQLDIEGEIEEKKNSKSQKIEEEKNEIPNKTTIMSDINTSPLKQLTQLLNNQQQIKPKSLEPALEKVSSVNEQIRQIIPIEIVDGLRDEILQELQVAELPDDMMKIFLTYKTLQTHSKYLPDEEFSLKVFNLLKIYRAIIEFQKQRKYFIQNIVQDQILKRFNYPTKINITKNPSYQNSQKFSKLAQQLNERISLKNDIAVKNKDASNLSYPQKTKKISKRQISDQNYSEEVSYNIKSKIAEKELSQIHANVLCERRLRDRKKKKNKKQKYEKTYSQNYLKDPSSREKEKQKEKVESSRVEKAPERKQNGKVDVELSQQDEGLIQKIQGWAQRAALAYAIQQKHKKSVKNSSVPENSFKNELLKTLKKDQPKKFKERSSKASQSEFKSMLNQKIAQQKTQEEDKISNLMTYVTSNNLSENEKEEFQKQMVHLTKELKNNQNHGKIRIGKQYYQAKMPNFIQSQTELTLLIKQKREKLMERKMGVLTF